MDRKTVLATAMLALVVGSGGAGVAVVKPALDKRDQLKADLARVEGERNVLRAEVAALNGQLSGMAMNTISYFDLSQEAEPTRALEARTVETLKSLTEIFNDHRIKVQSMEPKGETTGTSKPVPSPSPSPVTTGLANTIANLPGVAEPSPTPDPNAPPSPALISLVHKIYKLDVEGEYPDLVKALNEIQGLPKAISINEYQLKLVAAGATDSDAGQPQVLAPVPSMAPGASESLLGLEFQISITFLLSRPNVGPPPAPTPDAGASATTGALPDGAAAWLAAWDRWWCPPAAAATLSLTDHAPRPGASVRPWRQLWGGPSRPHAANSPRPLVLAPPSPRPPAPARAVAPRARAPVAPKPAARPRPTVARASVASPSGLPRRAPSRTTSPLDGTRGFHVLGRVGDVLTLSVDPQWVRRLPEPDAGRGLLGVRALPAAEGRRWVRLSLAPGQRVRAVVQDGRLHVIPVAVDPPALVAQGAAPRPGQSDPAAAWAKAFAPLAAPPAPPSAAPERTAPAPADPWEAGTDEGRRLLEQNHSVAPVEASPMLWASGGRMAPMRVATLGLPTPPPPLIVGPGFLKSVELGAGELRLRTQGPRPRVWVAERHANRLVLMVEGIAGSPKGLSHVVASGGVRAVTVLGPGLRPNTRLVSVAHDPRVRLEVHPGEPGGLRLSLHGQIEAPPLADLTPAAGAALLPDQLPRAAEAARPSPRPTARPTPRPTPRPLPRPMAQARPTPRPTPSLPPLVTRVPAGLSISASPKPMATPANPSAPTRHFPTPPTSSYRFPIDRDRATGRANPFRSLPNPMALATPASPNDASGLPVLPTAPGVPGAAPPAVPGTPASPDGVSGGGGTYTLSAVLVGGGSPPLAVIMVGDQAFQVRLNEVLPGNARVKLIQPDYVVLGLGGQDLRLTLRK